MKLKNQEGHDMVGHLDMDVHGVRDVNEHVEGRLDELDRSKR